MKPASAWGRLPCAAPAAQRFVRDRGAALPRPVGHSLLAHGLGRSYGDVALNSGGTLLLARGLSRFIGFDSQSGILRAEAGVSLGEILDLVTPHGWTLAVVPGTAQVTLGGAVANDVHGKNHHRVGSFGAHLRQLELLRSDGERIECGPATRADWFAATVGGLGLTGLIVWVELQLQRSDDPFVMQVVHRRFANLDQFWAIDSALRPDHAHTVAWIDPLHDGRGIYSAANAAQPPAASTGTQRFGGGGARLPLAPPFALINPLTRRLFNQAWFHRPLRTPARVAAAAFLFPLDAVSNWNRVYGPRGFYQYQCVLPEPTMREGLQALLRCLTRQRLGSALTVLKILGSGEACGLLSFARAGATLAMDFENRGSRTLRQLAELDAVVREARGALYPAKDARMPPDMFESSFPHLGRFAAFVDPGFSSNLWRRVQH